MAEEVLFHQQDHLGVITLNRPSALNALTRAMILQIQDQLFTWKGDPSIHAVILTATPAAAFCAGGDVRWLYHHRGQTEDQLAFFWHEYRLNHCIHYFEKPIIALMDGLTMGGGVGISLHASHPIASERFLFAMPETSIGFFPDIGASYLLNRCPGALGIYLGLTGDRIGPKDAMHIGLVKQIIPSQAMPGFIKALMTMDLSRDAHQQINQWVEAYSFSAAMQAPSSLLCYSSLIDSCFSQATIEDILYALKSADNAWARGVMDSFNQKSPLSLKMTLAQLNKAKGLSLTDCLSMDYDLVHHCMQAHDFYEGVRALLIDKDKIPQWAPAHLDLVSQAMVTGYFLPSQKKLDIH